MTKIRYAWGAAQWIPSQELYPDAAEGSAIPGRLKLETAHQLLRAEGLMA